MEIMARKGEKLVPWRDGECGGPLVNGVRSHEHKNEQEGDVVAITNVV